jgi:hypothetical protein
MYALWRIWSGSDVAQAFVYVFVLSRRILCECSIASLVLVWTLWCFAVFWSTLQGAFCPGSRLRLVVFKVYSARDGQGCCSVRVSRRVLAGNPVDGMDGLDEWMDPLVGSSLGRPLPAGMSNHLPSDVSVDTMWWRDFPKLGRISRLSKPLLPTRPSCSLSPSKLTAPKDLGVLNANRQPLTINTNNLLSNPPRRHFLPVCTSCPPPIPPSPPITSPEPHHCKKSQGF